MSPTELLAAMAYRREQFKNKVEEHVSGALLEHYEARLAKKNGQSKWVDHWTTEVHRLVERSMVAALVHPICGFTDRRRLPPRRDEYREARLPPDEGEEAARRRRR